MIVLNLSITLNMYDCLVVNNKQSTGNLIRFISLKAQGYLFLERLDHLE